MADLGLEVWLTGTPGELDAAARALAAIGRVIYRGQRIPLAGVDTGRYRAYARIRVPTATFQPAPVTTTGALIDLDTARQQRRGA